MFVLTVTDGKVLAVEGIGEQALIVGSLLGAKAGQLVDDDGDDSLSRVKVDATGHGGLFRFEGEHVVV